MIATFVNRTHGTAMTDLRALAEQASRRAYSPYSRFRVGAAVRTASGAVFTGCNVENAAYPLGICAERSAIAAAVGEEGPHCKILEVAVAAFDQHGNPQAAPPCGGCRQCLFEFAPDAIVHFRAQGGETISCAVTDLLPFAFRLQD